MVQINNMPDIAWNRKYIVCRQMNNEYWYYGSYDDIERANYAAKEVDGWLIFNESRCNNENI